MPPLTEVRPVRVIVPGEYWDSQIYAGRLYLFTQTGDIATYDWDGVVGSLADDGPLQLALDCALKRSSYLYSSDAMELLRDEEVLAVVAQKFARISRQPIELTHHRLDPFCERVQENLMPFPHTDCEIYLQKLYVSATSGLAAAGCSKRTKYPVSTRPKRLWDAPTLRVSGSWRSLALAAGSEGLFELALDDASSRDTQSKGPEKISAQHCADCSWMFYSIFGSTLAGEGLVATYRKVVDYSSDDDVGLHETPSKWARYTRQRDRVLFESDLFEQPRSPDGYSWAYQDKLYRAVGAVVEVTRYSPWLDEHESRFESLGQIRLDQIHGDVVSARVAFFGVIIEYDSGILVVPSLGEPLWLPGEPVNWRIFPRSKHYENQLHIVYEDRLEILSFNHDYLVDQNNKKAGVRRMTGSGRGSR